MCYRFVFAGLLLLLVPAAMIAAAEKPEQVISGKLIDADSQLPVADAKVSIPGTLIVTISNPWGEFEIRSVPDSTFVLRIEQEDHYTVTVTQLVPLMEFSNAEIRMHEKSMVDKLLQLVAGVQINTAGEVFIRRTCASDVSYIVDGNPIDYLSGAK